MMPLLAVFLLAIAIQLAFYACCRLLGQSKRDQGDLDATKGKGISIIVCARNEADNLRRHLPLWLRQNIFLDKHSESELIVIDDHSTDDTQGVVKEFCAPDIPLRLIRPPQLTRPGKKDALAYGISQARCDYLLLTDADCRPASEVWAQLMTDPLKYGAELVVGHGAYESGPDNKLSIWQVFTAEYHGLQYRCLTRLGWMKLGVGRNLAYTKDFFYARRGMQSHAHLAGGDDDLLLQSNPVTQGAKAFGGNEPSWKKTEWPAEVQNNKTAEVVDHPMAWTYSAPTKNWSEYARRKKRHFSIGRHYPLRGKVILGILALSHGLFYLLGLVLLFTPFRWWAIGIYLLRMLFVFLAYPKPKISWPLLDALLSFYLLWQAILSLFAQTEKEWEIRQMA
ncbi:MAG: glycosyltransferase [Bacteroidota bacterium]